MISSQFFEGFFLYHNFLLKYIAFAILVCNNIGTSGNTVGESGKKCFLEVLHIL